MSEKTAYIVGGRDYMVNSVFRQYGWTIVEHMEDAKVAIFTGGQDINPALYNEPPLALTHFSPLRDKYEIAEYYRAVQLGVSLLGICRGGQLINVLNGGKMWQDVNNHAGSPHSVKDLDNNKMYTVTSLHHQMMIPGPEAITVATSKESTERVSHHSLMRLQNNMWEDPEVVLYKKTKALCFQGHPEYGHKGCSDYFFELVDRYELISP